MAAVGYDSCSTASNHTLDAGESGVVETIEVLEAAGLAHSGSARTPEERASTIWIDVAGIRIAHLSYAYWFNGYTLPPDKPWLANQIDEATILADAAKARADGADLVVLSMHWGEQYQHQPNRQQSELGPTLLASPDVDLIVGHHAHVVQPIEQINGEWLIYGLGNFVSNQEQAPRRDELLVTAIVEEQTDGTFAVSGLDVLPVWLEQESMTMWPTGPSLRTDDPNSPPAADLDASWARTRTVLETGSGFDALKLLGE